MAETLAAGKTLQAQTEQPVLSINNIEVIYNHVILVLKGVSLEVPLGGITALLGANGAGKTTTLKAVSNLLRAERGDVTKGTIEFKGERIDQLTPNEMVKRGCIQVMEGRHCFEHLTVEENLLTGAFTQTQRKFARRSTTQDLETRLQLFSATERAPQIAWPATHRVASSRCARSVRALDVERPKMILLDEPSMGLAPQLVEADF